jgi:hypothetical protein
VSTHWHKNYAELAAAGRAMYYSAEVRDHHWDGVFLFRAYPNSGSVCQEATSEDKDELVKLAERWLAGEKLEAVYSASY